MTDRPDHYQLGLLLTRIAEHDQDYAPRNALVLEAVALAHKLGIEAGFRLDPAEPAWPVAMIELPMRDGAPGQISWHLPQHPIDWDGHNSEEKYARIAQWIKEAL